MPPVPDAAAVAPAALPDGGGAAEPLAPAPPPVEDIPGPAPQSSQLEVYFTLPMAHSQVLTSSRRPAALRRRATRSNQFRIPSPKLPSDDEV